MTRGVYVYTMRRWSFHSTLGAGNRPWRRDEDQSVNRLGRSL